MPAYVSNEEMRGNGSSPPEERKEVQRIYHEALKAKLSTGTVHVYIVAPDGHPIDSQHVATACQVDKLTAMLERTVERLKVPEGKPLTAATKQSAAPKVGQDELVLHLVARTLVKQGKELAPAKTKLGETRSIGWGSYPAENWVVLKKGEVADLLPAKIETGADWEIDPKIAGRFLTHFYPSTENNDVTKNRFDKIALKATAVSQQDGTVTARLAGELTMVHSFYHKEDGNKVRARLTGYMVFEPATGRVRTLRLITEEASYGRMQFGVAVRSVQ